MIRRLALAAVAAGVASCASGGSRSGGTPTPERTARVHVVRIRNFQFVPKSLTVAVGDSIIWINDDALPHTATADNASWRSPELPAGAGWGTRVTYPGMFEYHCEAHRVMRGSLTVNSGSD